MSICPCLSCIIDCFRSKPQKIKSADSEEEAFINQPHQDILNETIKAPSASSKNNKKQPNPLPQYFEEQQLHEQAIESDLLNVKLELSAQGPPKPEQSSGLEVKDIEDLIQQELSLTPQQAVVQHAEKKEQPPKDIFQLMEQEQEISQQSFTINLDPIDPFFPILHEKTSKISQQFSRKGDALQVGQPNKANLQVTVINNQHWSTFLLKYRIRSSYSFYQSLLKTDKLNSSFSPLIAEIKVIEALRPNLTKNTIKFKRLGSFQPRDCYYVKYQNSSKRQHWQIYIQDEKAELTPNYKTCELFCVKNIKEEYKELVVTEYLQIDLQSVNAASILPKLMLEYRNYLNNMVQHIQNNYEQETA